MKKLFILCLLMVSWGLPKAKVVKITPRITAGEINRLASRLIPDDTLLLVPGRYRVNIELKGLHGSPDRPIVIRGSERGRAVIDGGASMPGNSLKQYGLHLTDCSWVTIDNLCMEHCWVDAIRADNTSYLSLTRSRITGSRRVVFAQGRGSHHFLIEGCHWEQGEHVWTKEKQYSWEELHHGQYRHYNGSIFQGRKIGGSFVIRDNYIKNVYNGIRLSLMDDVGLDTLACANGEIYRNVIINSSDNAFEPEVYCKNLHFYHNRMTNSHAFISLCGVGGGPLYFYGNTGVKLPDCNDGWTIFKITAEERPFTKPFYVFNNSWQTDTDVWGQDDSLHWQNDCIRHFNNAYCITRGDTVGLYRLGRDNAFGNDCANLPFPAKARATAASPSLVADPGFVDGAHGNFLLRSGSPCRDAGVIPEDIEIDFVGDKLDIGAYDDGRPVLGPAFRYEELGPEMPQQEMPRIVRHRIAGRRLTLWLSSPLDARSVSAGAFELHSRGRNYRFTRCSLTDGGHVLQLEQAEELPAADVSLQVNAMPVGVNGQPMVLWASTLPAQAVSPAEAALNLTRRVAQRLMERVSFQLEPKPLTYNGNVARLHFAPAELKPGEAGYGYIDLQADSTKEALLGFAFEGNCKVMLNGTTLYQGTGETEDYCEYTYDRYRFPHMLPVHLNWGSNRLLVKCVGGSGACAFSCCVLRADHLADTRVTVQNNLPGAYAGNWLIAAPFTAPGGDALDTPFEPEQTLKPYYRQQGRTIVVRLQAPMLQPAFGRVAGVDKKGFNSDWTYANSNTLLGLLNLYETTGDERYADFVRMYNHHIDHHLPYFEQQYRRHKMMRGTYFRLFRASMLDDTGGSALPPAQMAVWGESTPVLDSLLQRTLHYVLHVQSRLPDGTLCRPEPVEHTVWCDDLFMSTAFLLRMAQVNRDPALYDEVARQILSFDRHLADPATGLYRHGRYHDRGRHSAVSWSRANGWMLWATSEALMQMPVRHPRYKAVKAVLVKRLRAILDRQSATGLWHQVLTDPGSYLETSGSAMFALALSRAIRMGWMPRSHTPQLMRAWQGVVSRIDANGDVQGICKGTDMSDDPQYYNRQPTVTNDPRGMGAVLTLGAEMSRFLAQ